MSGHLSPQGLRQTIRSGEHRGNTSGYAPGYVRMNALWITWYTRFYSTKSMPRCWPALSAMRAQMKNSETGNHREHSDQLAHFAKMAKHQD